MKKVLSLVLSFVMMFSLVACSDNASSPQGTDNNSQVRQDATLWAEATYTEDTRVGEGVNTVAVTVIAGEKQITITLKTDETTFGNALLNSGLITGSDGDYGLYISHVNGIKAVYEEDGAYWAFLDGEGNYMSYGVDNAQLTGKDAFQLVYTPA